MNQAEKSQLGKVSAYIDRYDASLLFPIPRAPKRLEIGITGAPHFFGADVWTAYELSWLNLRGKPQVALAHFTIPCDSINIIESKSFKLYLNSFNNTRFADADAVAATLRQDINHAIWQTHSATLGENQLSTVQSSAGVKILLPEQFDQEPVHELDGLSLDRLDIECQHYSPTPQLLSAVFDEAPVSEVLTSNLLKSNCLVTGQPDWASIRINYEGPQIDQAGLLQYIISFRNHNEFHEQCVERIFMDIWTQCKPIKLSVYARYTRRGGLDINPFRTSYPQAVPANIRTARQ
ncbi:MAG TPA: NADPH-dependent 7-cyano-7-deazaguanine reductase QueF [Burkholderiaceae bacterium]|nr:NADPH-dependent 7-cyano-7-deazaguanine reductase QueF [Burkholderiaceae bacterium]